MTIADLHNVVDMTKKSKVPETNMNTAKGIFATFFVVQLTIMAWHLSYWF